MRISDWSSDVCSSDLVLLIMVIVVASGCKKDFLDRKPLGQLTEEDLDPGSLEGQVFAIYGGGIRNEGISGLPYIAVHNMRADDADKGSAHGDGDDAANIFDKFQYVKDFWLINSYWTGHYNIKDWQSKRLKSSH